MKKTKFLLVSLFLAAVVISCSKSERENLGQLVTPSSTTTIAGANNGGNITCDEVMDATGCEFDESSGRINYLGGPGSWTVGPITWSTTDGVYVNWTSTVPVKVAVIVKGGPTARVYADCETCKTSGSILSAPVGPSGKPYGLSNITFCWSECEIVAIKAFGTIDDKYYFFVSSGTELFGSSPSWCKHLGYQDYTLVSSFDMMSSNGETVVGKATIDSDGNVSVSLTSGTLDKTYVFVGTLETFEAFTACPDYWTWPNEQVDGNTQVVEF